MLNHILYGTDIILWIKQETRGNFFEYFEKIIMQFSVSTIIISLLCFR